MTSAATTPRTSRAAGVEVLALATLVATLALVAFGGYTRGSGSGYGCADRWPLCEGGALGGILPRNDFHMIIEWTHRWIAAVVGVLALATAIVAVRARPRERRLVVPSVATVVVISIQALLGRQIVKGELNSDLVSFHLSVAMLVVALCAVTFVNARADRTGAVGPLDSRWSAAAGSTALLTLAVLLVGSNVHNVYVGGWPLVGDQLFPPLGSRVVAVHFVRRVLAATGTVMVGYLVVAARRRGRPRLEQRLVAAAVGAYMINIVLGAAHVATEVRSSAIVAAHLATASVAWAVLVTAFLLSRARAPRVAPATPGRLRAHA